MTPPVLILGVCLIPLPLIRGQGIQAWLVGAGTSGINSTRTWFLLTNRGRGGGGAATVRDYIRS